MGITIPFLQTACSRPHSSMESALKVTCISAPRVVLFHYMTLMCCKTLNCVQLLRSAYAIILFESVQTFLNQLQRLKSWQGHHLSHLMTQALLSHLHWNYLPSSKCRHCASDSSWLREVPCPFSVGACRYTLRDCCFIQVRGRKVKDKNKYA